MHPKNIFHKTNKFSDFELMQHDQPTTDTSFESLYVPRVTDTVSRNQTYRMTTDDRFDDSFEAHPPMDLRIHPRDEHASKDIEVIDLISRDHSPVGLQQPNYIPSTIHFHNQQRLTILPTYPTILYNNHPHLLLANVPPNKLSAEELARRLPSKYKSAFEVHPTANTSSSFMLEKYQIYFETLLARLRVDPAIIDHNYVRLQYFLEEFRKARMRILSIQKCSIQEFYLQEHEYPLLMEFYLQMDVDLFYMKTCSFRDAQPATLDQGLFCVTEPECRYTMKPCGNCVLCRTDIDMRYRQQPPIRFNRYERYRFVNGYESILNCPATCHTKNFIYVLTCLCYQFDFISETTYTLGMRLDGHRQLANNVIRKLFVGEYNFKHLFSHATNNETTHKENMLLYRHAMQCTACLQMFLDSNPIYWRFVPMTIDEAEQENKNYTLKYHRTLQLTSQKRCAPTTTNASITSNRSIQMPNESIQRCLDNVPKPPYGYMFSMRQIEKQMAFFQTKHPIECLYKNIDLYNATIIAVMPTNTSDLFRQIIHSLFVTHAETKLNTLGHIFENNRTINTNRIPWCTNLIRRPISSVSQFN